MRKLLLASFGIGALALFEAQGQSAQEPIETYSLVHAIGNSERVVQTGIALHACQRQRDELRRTATLIGAGGSVACLPESALD
jgi:hypothetical protein